MAELPTRATYPNLGLELCVGAGEVLARGDCLAHAAIDGLPVRATEHGTSAEERKRVVLRARVVDGDVPEHVLADLLREVDVDTQEVGWNAECQKTAPEIRLLALTVGLCSLDLLEESLEPTERRRVTTDPEEFYALEGTERALLLAVPDVLENGRERSDTDTSTNEHSNLDVEDILSRSAVGTVNANARERAAGRVDLHEVATRAVYTVVLLVALERCLGHRGDDLRAGTKTFSQCIGPVADLTDVNGDVGVLRRRRDGKLGAAVSQRCRSKRVPALTGCHCRPEISGTWMNNHWPATYLKLGLMIRSSMAPRLV